MLSLFESVAKVLHAVQGLLAAPKFHRASNKDACLCRARWCTFCVFPYIQCGAAAGQEYNMTKRLEHSYKSIFSDGKAISAVDPRYYSRRFQECMQKVFV